MTAVELIAQSLSEVALPEEPQEGVCCVTGLHCPTVARKHGIKPSFTNWGLLKAPDSERIGVAAWRVLTHSVAVEGKGRELRPLQQSSWLCTGDALTLLDRQGVRKHALDGVDAAAWCGYATTSYKKHGCLLTPVNTGGRQVWVFETRLVDCSDRAAVDETWARLRAAQDAGIPRPLIEQLDISPAYMAKIGWRLWRDFEGWARPRVRSPLYQFLAYLLPSKEELHNAGAS